MGTPEKDDWLEPQKYDEEALLQTAREGLSAQDRQEFEETVRAWQALHPDKPLIAMIVPVHPMHFYNEEELLTWASSELRQEDFDTVKGLIEQLHRQHPTHVVRGVELPNGDIHVVGIDPLAAQQRKQAQRETWKAHTDTDGWTWGPLPGDEGFNEYWKPTLQQRELLGISPLSHAEQSIKKPIPDEAIWKSVLAMDILDALKEE